MADFSVFVQHPALQLAVEYYEFYGMDGRLTVSRPIHRVTDFLSLLEDIATQANPWVIIVSHGNPNGLVMRLVDRRGSGNATSDALAILLRVHVVQEQVRELRDRPGERRPEDWFPILNLITATPSANERPVDILLNPPRGDTPEVQRLRDQVRQARETLAQRRRGNLPPGGLSDIDQEEREFLASTLASFASMVDNWVAAQARVMGLAVGDVENLIAAMKTVQALHLKRVLVRGCNLGRDDDERTMSALCYFLGAEILDAPRVYTIFGPLRVGIAERRPAGLARAARLGICGEEEVRRRRGCWWTFDVGETAPQTGTVRMHIRHRGGINYTAVAHSTSMEVLERWVEEHFGHPPHALTPRRGTVTFPVHFLLTAPVVFPRDREWTQYIRRVLGLQRG